MLVNDAFGRKVSLLNDTDGPSPKSSASHPSPKQRCLSRSNTFNFSRKSSYSSQMSHCSESSRTSLSENFDSPAYSPGLRPTPQLLRFDSNSSQQSIQTPSPTSPTCQIDPMDQSKTFPTGNPSDPYFRSAAGPYFATPQQPLPGTSQSPAMFASLDSPQAFTLNDPYVPLQTQAVQFAPYPTDLIPTPPMNLASPTSTVTPASSTPEKNPPNSGAKTAKKKYPCPHAQKYNCTDTFTTSGHAARHGKKHTGEKNIRCPVCDKAFTRKDNMKQHERTHRNNRDTASTTSNSAEPVKRTKTLSTESTETTETSTEMEIDSVNEDAQATIKPHSPRPRRPALTAMQPANPTTIGGHADIVMPVTLDSNEQLQQVAPELKLEPVGKDYAALGDQSFITRSQENFFSVRPPPLDRTTSTGSGFGSQDGEGESPGLDALAMAASMS